MKYFTTILLFAFVGLAFAQIDLDRIRERFGKDAEEFFKRFQDSEEFRNLDPFPRVNRNGQRQNGNRQRQNQNGNRQRQDQNRNQKQNQPNSNLLDKSNCLCRIKSSARIVGGAEAIPNSIPWQVSLASRRSHFCGGSIINSRFILSAQHCTEGKSPRDIEVRVGLHRLRDANSANTYAVKKIHNNNFDGDVSKPGDIVILELTQDIKFLPGQIEPACLGLEQKQYPGELIVSGWGTTSVSRKDRNGRLTTGELAPNLKKAHLHQETSNCQNFLICVNSNNNDSVCQGDSGGPIHYNSKGKTTVEGVASFVTGSAKFGSPYIELCTGHGAYSRNSYYKNWIIGIIGANNYCSA